MGRSQDECSEERFLSDIATHGINVIRDDGVNRHLRFRRPDTGCYEFDIITWSGHLCYTGDMGTFVFSRIKDMFEFFRSRDGRLRINTGYWGEKLLSISRFGGYVEFDEDKFKSRVTQYYNDWKEHEEPTDERAGELWEEIESQVLGCIDDGEHRAYQAAYDFSHDGFHFQDFFDGGGTERYTVHYVWCLYALVWGIAWYDKHRAQPQRE